MATQEEIDALKKMMRGAQVSGKFAYVEDGRHKFEIIRALCKRTNNDGVWKETYIAELQVLESSNPTHEAGSTRSYVEATENKGWLGRWKGFLAAAAGLDPAARLSAEDEDTISDIVAALRYDEYRISKKWPENFLKGRIVLCEGTPGKSLAGGPVTNKNWKPGA